MSAARYICGATLQTDRTSGVPSNWEGKGVGKTGCKSFHGDFFRSIWLYTLWIFALGFLTPHKVEWQKSESKTWLLLKREVPKKPLLPQPLPTSLTPKDLPLYHPPRPSSKGLTPIHTPRTYSTGPRSEHCMADIPYIKTGRHLGWLWPWTWGTGTGQKGAEKKGRDLYALI